MRDRHYHLHIRETPGGNEECLGDYASFETALHFVHGFDEAKFSLVSIVNLPYCLYGPDDAYQTQTYCVGRGVLHDAR